jgi:hypothetical protein
MHTLLVLLACFPATTKAVPDPTDPSVGPDDTARREDTARDTGNDTGDAAPAETVVRFVALGDAGEGNDVQYAIGQTMAEVCAVQGCDFALYLGDNFYDSGVDGLDDAQFDAKFEDPYAPLDLPFYIALGNHDYGGEGLGWELSKGQTYVDYSDRSAKWNFPDLFYSHTHGHATFFALDTTQLFWTLDEEQRAWLPDAVAQTNATWRIAYGHHPYTSNGPHGDAGSYEGLDNVPIVSGNTIRDFMDDEVCGTMDVYLCGHDHSLQWPEARCGTEFLVSGAGAKTTDLPGNDPSWFEQATPGFLWVELRGRTFTGVFYDQTGLELYRRTFTK